MERLYKISSFPERFAGEMRGFTGTIYNRTILSGIPDYNIFNNFI